ncbi:MAG: hypothetical protein J5823_03350 [Paludibacteraceae bacterium]|nr:hypothetical protein [Paludibacteraceae bacterium]
MRWIYKWLMTACVLCGLCHTVGNAYAYDRNAQSASWGYQSSAFSVQQSAFSSPQSATLLGEEAYPAYNFQSTSSYSSSVGNTSGGMTVQRSPRRSSPWDPPTDNPIGVVDNPEPIGEPWVLLLMAMAYIAILYCRRKAAKYQ